MLFSHYSVFKNLEVTVLSTEGPCGCVIFYTVKTAGVYSLLYNIQRATALGYLSPNN